MSKLLASLWLRTLRPDCATGLTLALLVVVFPLGAQPPVAQPDDAQAPKKLPAKPPKSDKVLTEFYHDFRNQNYPNENFRVAGNKSDNAAKKLIKPELEGLRISLPGELKDTVGVATQFNIQGDFEVTVGYEILKLDTPEGGVGAGLEFYLMTGGAKKSSLAFGRKVRPDGSDVYTCSGKITNQKGKRVFAPGAGMMDIPATGKAGRLSVTRIGPTFFLSAADASDKPLRVLHRVDLGTDDITLLRLSAHPGDFTAPVDLRLVDLRARAESLGAVVVASPPPRGTALWLVLALLAVLVVIAGLLFWWTRKRKASTPAIE